MSRPECTEEEFKAQLKKFITEKLPQRSKGRADLSELAYDTELFENGYVTSLGIVQLIAFVETLFGITVSLREITIAHFNSIDSIAKKFFSEADSLRQEPS